MSEKEILHERIEIKNQLMNVEMFSEFLREGLQGYELDRGIIVTLDIKWTNKKVTPEEAKPTKENQ